MRDPKTGRLLTRAENMAIRRRQLAESPHVEAAAAFFATPHGTALMDYLGHVFDSDDIQGDTPEETNFNLGARWMYRSLRNLATLKQRLAEAEQRQKERTEKDGT